MGCVSRDTSHIIGQRKLLCRAYLKEINMPTFTETIKLTDKKKLCKVTNEDNWTNESN